MSAGMVTYSAANLCDASGNLISNATIKFTPVLSGGQHASFQPGGGGVVMQVPVTAQVVNGAFSISLMDTTATSPINVGYAVTVISNITSQSLLGPGYGCVQNLAGTGLNLDNYKPQLAAQITVQPGPAGPSAYQLAVAAGFAGTQAQWLTSLVGPPGVGQVQFSTLSAATGDVFARLGLAQPQNLFDSTKGMNGYYDGSGGWNAGGPYWTTGPIPVFGLDHIILNVQTIAG